MTSIRRRRRPERQRPSSSRSEAAAKERRRGELQERPGGRAGALRPAAGGVQEPPAERRCRSRPARRRRRATPPRGPQELSEAVGRAADEAVPPGFYTGFWLTCVVILALLAWYYWRFDAEQYEILRCSITSVMPLGILTLVVLGVILFGITTATESAAVGAAGAFLMAWRPARSIPARPRKRCS